MATIYVIYHSDTGNTHALAKLVAEGIGKVKGVEAKLVPAAGIDLATAALADGYAIGSPDYFSYVAGSVKTFFDNILYHDKFKGKPYVGFGTHGGGGKVLEVLDKLAKACGLRQVGQGLMVKASPGKEHVGEAHDLGKALANAVTAKP
jgi:flavorubredoxin